ncbi:MAG TPA: hypothetical protein VK780_08465 [Thermoanaerobaculia bacterium]|nr:hypothetical protein [Thermoanaerobaculia bacterium]
MARLGQLLVRADLVSENNLARALGIQHFAGGRLGTLLLERGSIEEDNLGKTLALQHGCEYIPWRRLAEIPPIVIAALPAKFAIKHAAVPYDRGENSLKLALRDPGDLRILDELFFVTGRKIIAGVAPEVRIYQALEKYYGERRTPRYAILAEKLSRPARTAKAQPAALPPPPDFFPSPARKRSGVVPSARDLWEDAGDPDLDEPPIIQSWTVPDHALDQAVGGWAGSLSPGMEGVPPPEPESISWEEMPSIPGLWMPEPSSSPPGSPPGSAAARESGRIFLGSRPFAPPASELPSARVEASAARPVPAQIAEVGPPPTLAPDAATPPPPIYEKPRSVTDEIVSSPVPTHLPATSPAAPASVATETPAPEKPVVPEKPVEAAEAVSVVASASREAEEPVFLREPAKAPAHEPALPPSTPAEPAGESTEAAAEVSAMPPAPPAPIALPVSEPEPATPVEPLPVETPPAAVPSPAPTPVSAAALAAMPSATDFPQVASAIDRDAIATAALEALARRFVRAAIFVSRPDSVTAWGGLGEGVSPEELRDISIPWKDPSIFLNIRLSRSFYLGPLPPLPRHESIAIAMGGWPEECLIQPVYLKEKPVAFLYAEFSGDHGATPMDLAYMRELAAAASSAFVAAIRLKKREI